VSESQERDSDEAEAVRAGEDGLRVVPEGYDPQQVHELLAGYKAQMDRLEQVLGSVQAALGVTGEEQVAGEDLAPPDARALQLAADYRPSTLRFDPGPISSRVAPGAPLPVRPRSRNTGLVSRMLLEGAFIVLVILALAVLQQPPRVILLGAGAAWLGVVLVVEVLLVRLHARVLNAQEPVVVAAPAAARPDVVALRLPHPPEPVVAPEPALEDEPEPVDAVTGPDDVWVVPQEVLIAEPVLFDLEDEPAGAVAPLLDDTLESELVPDEPAGEAPVEEPALDPEPQAVDVPLAAEAVPAEAEPEAAVEPQVEPPTEPESEQEVGAEAEPDPPAAEAPAPLAGWDVDTAEDASPPEPYAGLLPEREADGWIAVEAFPSDDAPDEGADELAQGLLPEPAEEAPEDELEAEPAWADAPLATDSWALLGHHRPVTQTPSQRRWPFGRRPEAPPPAARPLYAPPDPELSRAAPPLPPVLIDPLADGTRRSRRRRA
jgi:hypothetical protein